MKEFPVIPATKRSFSCRKIAFGVGVNDAAYQVKPRVDGKMIVCPFYQRWLGMIERCYSDTLHKRRPTYIGCTVCDDWLVFSNFKSWMINQDWEGMHLDKDIIIPGNKVYSPDNCAFVTQELNMLLTDRGNARGAYPVGVTLHKPNNTFRARVVYNGKKIHLGLHSTPQAAYKSYVKAKVKIIIEAASEQSDCRIANGLKLHAEILSGDF